MPQVQNFTEIAFYTAVGPCKLICSKVGIRKFILPFQLNRLGEDFNENLPDPNMYSSDEYKYYMDLISRIRMYFMGGKVSLNDELDYGNTGNFTKLVWEITRSVPHGETRSYKWIATQLKCANVRAIGWALNRNQLPIFVPCHRIIKDNGDLGGFRWGAKNKEYLLRLESNI